MHTHIYTHTVLLSDSTRRASVLGLLLQKISLPFLYYCPLPKTKNQELKNGAYPVKPEPCFSAFSQSWNSRLPHPKGPSLLPQSPGPGLFHLHETSLSLREAQEAAVCRRSDMHPKGKGGHLLLLRPLVLWGGAGDGKRRVGALGCGLLGRLFQDLHSLNMKLQDYQ